MRSAGIQGTIDDLLDWARSVVGETVTTTNHTWPHDRSLVLELVGETGNRYFLKHPRDGGRFKREMNTYRTTLTTMSDAAPKLLGCNEEYRSLLLEAIPGKLVRGSAAARDPNVHQQAGRMLARFHRSDWPVASPRLGIQLAEKRSKTLERAKDVLGAADFRRVRKATAAVLKPAIPMVVPCHGDFWARNWITGEDGGLYVIDFGQASRDLAVRDLTLLARRDWLSRPELRDAFFDGYGRQLTAHEEDQLHGLLILSATGKVVRAQAMGNRPIVVRMKRQLAEVLAAAAAAKRAKQEQESAAAQPGEPPAGDSTEDHADDLAEGLADDLEDDEPDRLGRGSRRRSS